MTIYDTNPLYILTTGSRDYTDAALVSAALRSIYAMVPDYHAPSGIVVRHGDGRGADQLVDQQARALGWATHKHPAQWDTYGREAGMRRNREMARAENHIAVAFPLHPLPDYGERMPGSVGTWNTVFLAAEQKLPVFVVWGSQLWPYNDEAKEHLMQHLTRHNIDHMLTSHPGDKISMSISDLLEYSG